MKNWFVFQFLGFRGTCTEREKEPFKLIYRKGNLVTESLQLFIYIYLISKEYQNCYSTIVLLFMGMQISYLLGVVLNTEN